LPVSGVSTIASAGGFGTIRISVCGIGQDPW